MTRRVSEKHIERRQRPGGNHIRIKGFDVLDPPAMNRDFDFAQARGLSNKGAFSLVGLDQVDVGRAENGCYQAGQAGAAAQVGPAPCPFGGEKKELRGIENVPAPNVLEAVRADEIDLFLPARQCCDIRTEPLQGFT